MSSNIFKRIACFLLSVVLVLGLFPASVLAAEESDVNMMSVDSNAAVGMTVSVGSSLVTIDVSRVGVSGTATLYRVAAGEYLEGDELTGLSKQIVSAGAVIGEYSCGSTQQFVINRYLSDGSVNLYDKYYLVQNGTILQCAYY